MKAVAAEQNSHHSGKLGQSIKMNESLSLNYTHYCAYESPVLHFTVRSFLIKVSFAA